MIDTPSLNDVVEFRSNITRDYIDRANAVFMCVKSDSLTGEELQTLHRVFTNTKGKIDKVYRKFAVEAPSYGDKAAHEFYWH